MKKQSGNIVWLINAVLGIGALGLIVNTANPSNSVSVILFICTVVIILYSLSYYLPMVVYRSFLVSGGIGGLLLLRYIGLREPVYVLLLICCLISLELLFQKS